MVKCEHIRSYVNYVKILFLCDYTYIYISHFNFVDMLYLIIIYY